MSSASGEIRPSDLFTEGFSSGPQWGLRPHTTIKCGLPSVELWILLCLNVSLLSCLGHILI